jgi:phage recombination protein Bet
MEGNMTSSLVTMPREIAMVSTNWDTPENRALILKTVAPGLNETEAALFFHVARERHLDPLQKQIYAIKRRTWVAEQNGGQGGYEERMVLQVGVDGFRSIANRTGLYMPSDKLPLVEGQGTPELRVTVWVRKYHEMSKQWMEFGAVAYYREFVQVKKDKTTSKMVPVQMWERMPLSQTEKCAEVKALRRGWPEELGGVYAPEEVQRDPENEVLPPEFQKKQDKTKRDLGTMKPSSEPNRGHGQEGTQRQQQEPAKGQEKAPEKEMCAECRLIDGHTDDCKNNPKNKPAQKLSKREQWAQSPGHDPKIHIGFADAVTLFNIQKDLGIKEEDFKSFLDREFEIQHRYLIRQDMLQKILDAIREQYAPKTEPPATEGDGMPDFN